MKRGKLITGVFLALMLVSFISAVTCDTIPQINGFVGESISPVSINCNNPTNESVTLNKLHDYFTLSTNILNPGSESLTLTFSPFTSSGDLTDIIYFSDGTQPLQANINIQTQNSIVVFPTNKVITVQQETEKTQNILISVPSNYPSALTIQSVDFNPGTETIKFGDLNLGQVSPGQSVNIPIIFSGIDAAVGTYQTSLSIFATDSYGQVSLSPVQLQLQITQGVTPITNATFSTRPTCSLDKTTANLNESVTFSCSNINNQNIRVTPQYSEFFQGKSVDSSGGIYSYVFQPIKYGNFNFISLFTYQGSPIFAPFIQEMKISSAGAVIPGTNLKLLFTPSLSTLTSGQETIIQLIDNKTGSLVESPQIYIDAVLLSSMNSSANSFKLALDSGKNYEVRGKASGYEDLLEIINITKQIITVTITPVKEMYTVGETINITNEVNATTLIDNVVVNGEFTFAMSGTSVLEVKKEGYETFTKNLTSKSGVSYISMSPDWDKWKKGKKVSMELANSTNWVVTFEERVKEDGIISYKEPIDLETGNSDLVEFKISKYGIYSVKSGEFTIITADIDSSSFFRWNNWLIWIVIVIVIVAAYFLLVSRDEEEDEFPLGGNESE